MGIDVDHKRSTRMKPGLREVACYVANGASWVYLLILFTWLAAYLAAGDRFGYLAALNLLAVYLFSPLALVLLAVLSCRARSLGIGFLAGLAAFLWLWGGLFLPRPGPAQAGGRPTLTVMTYNVLAWHTQTGPVLETIRHADPDVVFIQELNHTLSEVLQAELAAEYPYQILEPLDRPSGIGTISKYPIQPTGERPPLRWIGGPIIATMDWNGRAVTLVNFHMLSTTGLHSQAGLERDFRAREEQARFLVDLTRRSGPAILGGDANSAPLNAATKILTADLQDAWRNAGFGLGHTFPGSTIPGSDRPRLGPVYVPAWLARIDYIFHTDDWETVTARLARFDGVSDHRGVVAVLRLQD